MIYLSIGGRHVEKTKSVNGMECKGSNFLANLTDFGLE